MMPTSGGDPLQQIEAAGFRPVFVAGLTKSGVILPEHGLALIRSGLAEEDLQRLAERVTDFVVERALEHLAL